MAPEIALRFPADPHPRSTRSQARSPSSLSGWPATPTDRHAEARRLELLDSRSFPSDRPTRVPDSIHCLLSSATRRAPPVPKAPLLSDSDSQPPIPEPWNCQNGPHDFDGPLHQTDQKYELRAFEQRNRPNCHTQFRWTLTPVRFLPHSTLPGGRSCFKAVMSARRSSAYFVAS